MEVEEYLGHCRELVAEIGWMIQGVVPTHTFGSGRSYWYYTVGLTGHDHPEFTISGPDPVVAKQLLNDLGWRVAREGQRFEHGQQLEDLVAGYPVELVEVDRFDEFSLSMVEQMFPDRAVHALQVVLPDSERRFPWDPGYAMTVQEMMRRIVP